MKRVWPRWRARSISSITSPRRRSSFGAGVQLEQVDVVGAQSGEAAGDALLERGRAPVIPPGAFEVTAFGEEEILGSAIRDRLVDEGPGGAGAPGGVDE